MKHLLCTATLAFASLVALPASAVPITYKFDTAGATGTLDGSAFTTSGVTFTLNADTDDVAPTPAGDLAVTASSATVTFDGMTLDILSSIGLYSFSGGFGMWRPDDSNLLENSGGAGVDLSLATSTTSLTYDYTQWSGFSLADVNTSAGVLVFEDQPGVSGSFGAALVPVASVPLPAAGWMLLAALGALVGRSRAARAISSQDDRKLHQTGQSTCEKGGISLDKKMKINIFLGAAALAVGVSAGAGLAATLTIDATGQLTGATDVTVEGSLYDLTFAHGSCAGLFMGCDDAADFIFPTAGQAISAAQALLDQVLIDGPLGQFDSHPELVAGISIHPRGPSRILIPYGDIFTWLGTQYVNGYEAVNGDATQTDEVRSFTAVLARVYAVEQTGLYSGVYARWTAALPDPDPTPSPVPLPAAG